jgi:predicted MPP superfamily phosphohydrolase
LGIFARGARFAGLYGRGRLNALRPELAAFDLPFPSLPASFDGYRILHISDPHLDALPELGAVAAELLAGVEVDLIALTGDIMAAHDAKPAAAVGPLEPLLRTVAVRDRRLAVLGNHDAGSVADALGEIGFEVLINRSLSLERNDEHIAVTGLDDVHCFYTEAAHAALFEDVAADFRIALVHSPEMADHAATAGVSLYLCGHTHGGQICLPNGRWLLTRLTRCRQAARGLWREGPMTGYTSRGLGVSAPPFRFNCPGEMTLITLRRLASPPRC